jgi:hypothetical protein
MHTPVKLQPRIDLQKKSSIYIRMHGLSTKHWARALRSPIILIIINANISLYIYIAENTQTLHSNDRMLVLHHQRDHGRKNLQIQVTIIIICGNTWNAH